MGALSRTFDCQPSPEALDVVPCADAGRLQLARRLRDLKSRVSVLAAADSGEAVAGLPPAEQQLLRIEAGRSLQRYRTELAATRKLLKALDATAARSAHLSSSRLDSPGFSSTLFRSSLSGSASSDTLGASRGGGLGAEEMRWSASSSRLLRTGSRASTAYPGSAPLTHTADRFYDVLAATATPATTPGPGTYDRKDEAPIGAKAGASFQRDARRLSNPNPSRRQHATGYPFLGPGEYSPHFATLAAKQHEE